MGTSHLLVFVPWPTVYSKTDFYAYHVGVRGGQLAIYLISKTDVFTCLKCIYVFVYI